MADTIALTRTQAKWLGELRGGEGEIPLASFTILSDLGLIEDAGPSAPGATKDGPRRMLPRKGYNVARLTAAGRQMLGIDVPEAPAGVSRQVRRAAERRAGKPLPGPVALTSRRHMLRKTKGLPFSRCKLAAMTPGTPGRPAILVLEHPTKGTVHTKSATPGLMAVFFPALPDNLAASMLGAA